jgi:hypothetical protein
MKIKGFVLITVGRLRGITREMIFTKTARTAPLPVARELEGYSTRRGETSGTDSNTYTAYTAGSVSSFAGQYPGTFMVGKIK